MNTNQYPAVVASVTQAAREVLHLDGNLLAAWAHGRVNLIGEHTDYNDGWVLPITVAQAVAFVGRLTSDPDDTAIHLYSPRYQQVASFSTVNPPNAADPQGVPGWARYIAGVVGILQQRGVVVPGFTGALDGDIPASGGMSSSAALLMATLTWFNEALKLDIAPLELARVGQQAETLGSGVHVGILDQAASVLGKPGYATLIDCRSMEYQYIPFALQDTSFLMADTGVERTLANSGYNERRAQCEAAVQAFTVALHAEGDTREIRALRDVTWRDYLRLAGHLPEPVRWRARHVLTENERTLTAVEAFRRGDAQTFGALILQSHASLRDDYAVSCQELDAVVEIATTIPGALGARLMGAGFGGAAMVVAHSEAVDAIKVALRVQYPVRTGKQPTFYEVVPNGGPGFTLMHNS